METRAESRSWHPTVTIMHRSRVASYSSHERSAASYQYSDKTTQPAYVKRDRVPQSIPNASSSQRAVVDDQEAGRRSSASSSVIQTEARRRPYGDTFALGECFDDSCKILLVTGCLDECSSSCRAEPDHGRAEVVFCIWTETWRSSRREFRQIPGSTSYALILELFLSQLVA